MDTERIISQLRELPPELPEPGDRFEQIAGRVRRRRRQQTTVAAVTGVAVLALAVPIATQLLPESAVGPAVGPNETNPYMQVTQEDLPPGGTRLTHHTDPMTVSGVGTQIVDLGTRPTEATSVAMVLDCLSAGEFTYPDGAGMICGADDAPGPGADIPPAPGYVIPLPEGQEDLVITATEGAEWRLTTAYVSTEVTEWGVNAKGETYGVQNERGEPDLISVSATNGKFGYAYVADMNAADGPEPTSPEHALEMQEERAGQTVSVPVYESDGETVIGEFVIGGASGGGDVSTSTATSTDTMVP